MADVLFVAITVAFFVVCVFYVNWCDRIIGPDDFVTGSSVSEDASIGDDVATDTDLAEATS